MFHPDPETPVSVGGRSPASRDVSTVGPKSSLSGRTLSRQSLTP